MAKPLIKGTEETPGRGKIWVKSSRKKGKSTSYRREKHEREATTVIKSKKIFHRAHPRRKRRKKADIESLIKRASTMTLLQKKNLSLRDRRVLERRGLL